MILAILFLAQQQQAAPAFHSKLAVFEWKTRQSTVIYEQDEILETPNRSRDGEHLLVNTGGNLHRSPDAKLVAFSVVEHRLTTNLLKRALR